jgi:MOSC domain-containing protein YiiM
MFQGKLLAIHLAPTHGGELHAVEQADAVPGCGLAGDRFYQPLGTASPESEITLIEQEALVGMAQEDKLDLAAPHSRRNLLTEGVPLNHLVGKEFRVGGVRLKGIELCEPCGHLEKLTFKGVKKGLCHRGGLRAQIITGGTLRVGDAVTPA